ncbi:MAG: hypothetical protein ABSH22_00895 [Tepidisphaeraceae bacterium]
MIRRTQPNIGEIMASDTLVGEALARGVRRALLRHKKLGESVVVWRDGGPVIIPAEEIPDDDPDSAPAKA